MDKMIYRNKASKVKALKTRFKKLNPNADVQEIDFDAEVDSKASLGENLKDLAGSYPWFRWTKQAKPKTNDTQFLKEAKRDLEESGFKVLRKADYYKLARVYKTAKLPKVIPVIKVKHAPPNHQTGRATNILLDKMRRALPVGKRTSSTGRVYYEKRRNRSDLKPSTGL